MSAAQLAAYQANSGKSGTAAADLVAQCQDTIDNASSYDSRGGSDGNAWPQSAVACAFAYVATKDSKYLTQALTYWHASLNDDQTIGDAAGCVQGVSTDWQSWEKGGESGSAPPVLVTITHDTGYPIRWYGADLALTYDWLYGASGVDSALQAQTRTCLTSWIDWYTGYGYHHDEAGANYNAGYVVSKALAAIAIGNDAGADGHLWTQVIDQDFGSLLMGTGLSGMSGAVGTPAGVMVGGDWGEGWQYGPLSVIEYAAAARALDDSGATTLAPMQDWASSLVLRSLYATIPGGGFGFCGNGDCDIPTPNKALEANDLDAVLVGPSTDQAAAWALAAKQGENLHPGGYVYNAIAEARPVTAQDYTKQTPAPSPFYVARGTRQLYARSGWDAGATWGVFMSEPQLNSDHQHFDASNFVLSRGSDDLVVDPTPYGNESSWQSNAVTADSSGVTGDYAPSQTPWSQADLPWARGTADATYGARSDFASAFVMHGSSDITYAHREWTMLPAGEVVTIDRVHTGGSSENMYVQFHTNTGGGGLTLSNGVATGTVGASKVAIHAVLLSGGTPAVKQPTDCSSNSNDACCSLSCSYPCGSCTVGRFAADEYQVAVPGPWAVAVHVIDALGSSESPATVASLGDASVDPSGQNTGVIGASVSRAGSQSYVVASSATDGACPNGTLTYGTPGASTARHVVYDAPEASDGTSSVVASAQGGRCTVTVTAGSGKGLTGHPLMFDVSPASSGCKVTDATSANPGTPPSGGDAGAGSSGGSGGSGSSGGAGGSGGSSGGVAGGSSSGGASVDGGVPSSSGSAAGTNSDDWSNLQGGGSGCGCLTAGESRTSDTLVGLALLPLAAAFVRRRRR